MGIVMQTKRTWPILLLFFCSGATALVYEVIWSKYLSQMFRQHDLRANSGAGRLYGRLGVR